MRCKPTNGFDAPAYVPPTINDRLLYSLETALSYFVVILIIVISGDLFYMFTRMPDHGISLAVKSNLSYIIAHAWEIVIMYVVVFTIIYGMILFIHPMDGDQSIDKWRVETGRYR